MYRWFTIIITMTLFGGCAPFTPAQRPDAPVRMPAAYSLYSEGVPVADHWWESFDSPELNRLVETALSGNFDIRTALARLRQADAVARQAGAALMPTVDVTMSGEINRTHSQTTSQADGVTSEDKTWYAGLGAAYEVDLWGRLRAQKQSQSLEYQAVEEDLTTARMTVAANVVQTWIDLVATRKQIDILETQIKTNEDLLSLEKIRFANGQAQALDVSQQQEALAAAKAQMPQLRITENQLRSTLTILLGKAMDKDIEALDAALPELIPLPAVGVPADLLAARPDVRAAGLRLKSADWSVAAARADRLPNITLSATAAYSSGKLDLLFNNWFLNLAAAVTGPVFDAGSRQAEVDRTRAVADEYLAAYAQTVAQSIREVEDSLVEEKQQETYINLLNDQLAAARISVKDARLLYLNGQSDYLSYLTAWTSVQSLERQLIAEQAGRIKYRVTLYRALGGSWSHAADERNDSKKSTSSAEVEKERQNGYES